MGWGGRQWLRITKESTYGTFDGSAASDDIIWVRLPGSNQFTLRPVKERQVIRASDGGNRPRQVVAARTTLQGNLSTLFYPTQAAYFLSAAIDLTSYDLASYTIDYYDSVRTRRYLGCKVEAMTLTSTATQDYVPLQLSWRAQKYDKDADPTLAEPADTVFPTEVPYEHVETKGSVSVAGAAIAKYRSLTVSINNLLSPTWDEDEFISACYWCGRNLSVSLEAQYLNSTRRGQYESQAGFALSAAWARAGGLTTTLDFQDLNRIEAYRDDLPLDNAAYSVMQFQGFYSNTNSTDLEYTVA